MTKFALPFIGRTPSPTEDFQLIEKDPTKVAPSVQTPSTSWFGSKKVTATSSDSSATIRPTTEAGPPPTPPRALKVSPTGSPETAKKPLLDASSDLPKVTIFGNFFGSSGKPEASAPASPITKKEVSSTTAQVESSTPPVVQANVAATTGGGFLGFFSGSKVAETPKQETAAASAASTTPAVSNSTTAATAQKASSSWFWGSSTPPETPVVATPAVTVTPEEKPVEKPKSWNWTQTFTLGYYGAEVETQAAPVPAVVAVPSDSKIEPQVAQKASLVRRTSQAFVRAIKYLNPLNVVYFAKSLLKREDGTAEGSTRKWFILKWPAISIRDNRITNFLVDNRVSKFLADNRVTNSLKAVLTACTYANAKAAAGSAGTFAKTAINSTGTFIAAKGRLLLTGTCAFFMGAYRLLCKLPIPSFRKKANQELFEDTSKSKDAVEAVVISRKQAFLQGVGAGAVWLAKETVGLPARLVSICSKNIPVGVVIGGIFIAAVGHAIKEHNA